MVGGGTGPPNPGGGGGGGTDPPKPVGGGGGGTEPPNPAGGGGVDPVDAGLFPAEGV